MNEPHHVERGGLHFTRSGLGGVVVTCTLGAPGEAGSETVFCVHEAYLPAMIAGLVAMDPHPGKRKETKG